MKIDFFYSEILFPKFQFLSTLSHVHDDGVVRSDSSFSQKFGLSRMYTRRPHHEDLENVERTWLMDFLSV